LAVQTAAGTCWHAALHADAGDRDAAGAALDEAWRALNRVRPEADAIALALSLGSGVT
jgi:hypothetical protein